MYAISEYQRELTNAETLVEPLALRVLTGADQAWQKYHYELGFGPLIHDRLQAMFTLAATNPLIVIGRLADLEEAIISCNTSGSQPSLPRLLELRPETLPAEDLALSLLNAPAHGQLSFAETSSEPHFLASSALLEGYALAVSSDPQAVSSSLRSRLSPHGILSHDLS